MSMNINVNVEFKIANVEMPFLPENGVDFLEVLESIHRELDNGNSVAMLNTVTNDLYHIGYAQALDEGETISNVVFMRLLDICGNFKPINVNIKLDKLDKFGEIEIVSSPHLATEFTKWQLVKVKGVVK